MTAPMAYAWEGMVRDFFLIDGLHDYQRKTLRSFLDGKDVFLSVRTGGGKSLCYMGFPAAAKARRSAVSDSDSDSDSVQDSRLPSGEDYILIVSPLNAIMKEQSNMLNSMGFKAACLARDSRDTGDILAGKYHFLFTSPETLLKDQKFRGMLRSSIFKGGIGLIVFDEAHTVVQW